MAAQCTESEGTPIWRGICTVSHLFTPLGVPGDSEMRGRASAVVPQLWSPHDKCQWFVASYPHAAWPRVITELGTTPNVN